jgi:ABC-type nickel/cobalt efflux system permease component RcnA
MDISSSSSDTSFDIEWLFERDFVSKLKQYDTNKDNIFDTNEQNEIKKSLDIYLPKVNYSTKLIYNHKDKISREDDPLNIASKSSKLIIDKDGSMRYLYSYTLPITLQKDNYLYIDLYDKGGNFNFHTRDIVLSGYSDKYILKPESRKAHILFFEPSSEYEGIRDERVDDTTIVEKLANVLDDIKKRVQRLLSEIDESGSIISYIWLLLFSFAYGILHTLGPGHGKSLVSAYFLSSESSYARAGVVSMLIGVVHTFSAFITTFVIYFVLSTFFASVVTDIESVATKISAIIIILIAVYLIYKKYIFYKESKKPTMKWSSHQPHSSCSCSSCQNTNTTDLGVILGAGIVPCAGTVSIFIFTISLGLYFVGFLSAIFMSIGMSFVIFVTALISTKIKKSTTTNRPLVIFFEYGSLVFILGLGLVLLLLV